VIARYIPATILVLFVGVGFGWRVWLHRRRYGESGIVLFRSGRPLQHARDAAAILLFAGFAWQALAVAIDGDALNGARLVATSTLLSWIGAALGIIGTGLMVVAQLELGSSWRIGIDQGARPGLVTSGIYRFCRNPIFLAMGVALLGLTLLLPTALAIASLIVTLLGIRRQVLDEEAYLQRVYSFDFAAYADKVGRFVPLLGRIRNSRPNTSPA
jgi:protein-S-isoprenylcysteine O-methyltransferase Ste14